MGRGCHRCRHIAFAHPPFNQAVAGARRVEGGSPLGLGLGWSDQGGQGLPCDREIGDVRLGPRLIGDKRHAFAAKAGGTLRDGGLVGKGRDHAKGIAPRNIDRRKYPRDTGAGGKSSKITERKRGVRVG